MRAYTLPRATIASIRRGTRSYSAAAAESTLQVEDRDRIRWITLNRPKSLNALAVRDLDDLAKAVESASSDPAIRAIALQGAGRAFCAGMNTHAFAGLDRAGAREVIAKVGRAVGSLRVSPKPTAVLMHGYCLGAGFEMALAADLRVALPGTKVGLPETKVGIPSVLDAALLRDHVGLSLAKEMLLIGDVYPIEHLGRHFVNAVGGEESGGLQAAAAHLLAKVTDLSPVAMKAQKELNEMWMNTPLKEAIDISIDVFADVFVDPATHEAIQAYNKKQ
ncbi:3-hydroxypropionyl-coenzyme A dehydratase [Vanrija pseudolonga]|uniref:3-hydroxypropionyl-coenzyme A dehydratase n=1 Tax=Vanrija pseudolonga TaxID=143232 RepID=A0AAF0YD83_9TREE|nr:3-hydroxypropionyl-coenzyme A dehydratase [Vanrija pseudolonga]